MNDTLFKRILMIIMIVGIISIIALCIITVVLYKQVSMITFIEKEIW
ncbi:MAG: hypothetical protein J5666_00940 [Bacilli bacterium]|nr:hypothetical protein [Bacilli bacterium]